MTATGDLRNYLNRCDRCARVHTGSKKGDVSAFCSLLKSLSDLTIQGEGQLFAGRDHVRSAIEQHFQLLSLGQPILKPVYDHSTGSLCARCWWSSKFRGVALATKLARASSTSRAAGVEPGASMASGPVSSRGMGTRPTPWATAGSRTTARY